MNSGRIIIITGTPGTGKTTIPSITAKESNLEKSAHIHTDDFYHYLSKGAVPPHLPESNEQNSIVIEAFLEAAKSYARSGYDVIVDGIIEPWFLKPLLKIVRENYEVHYIILRADRKETVKRATGRSKLDNEANIELMENGYSGDINKVKSIVEEAEKRVAKFWSSIESTPTIIISDNTDTTAKLGGGNDRQRQ